MVINLQKRWCIVIYSHQYIWAYMIATSPEDFHSSYLEKASKIIASTKIPIERWGNHSQSH